MDPSHMHLLWGCGQEQQGREDGTTAIAFQVKIGAPWDASTSSVFPKKKTVINILYGHVFLTFVVLTDLTSHHLRFKVPGQHPQLLRSQQNFGV